MNYITFWCIGFYCTSLMYLGVELTTLKKCWSLIKKSTWLFLTSMMTRKEFHFQERKFSDFKILNLQILICYKTRFTAIFRPNSFTKGKPDEIHDARSCHWRRHCRGQPWRAPWRQNPNCCYWMSRFLALIPTCVKKSVKKPCLSCAMRVWRHWW